jgi:biotin transporter BioY
MALICGWLSERARCVLRAAKPPHAKAMRSIFVALQQCYILGCAVVARSIRTGETKIVAFTPYS